jgi:hypothetical protein
MTASLHKFQIYNSLLIMAFDSAYISQLNQWL